MKKENYIIVAFYNGFAYVLQYRNVISNIFYNNTPKTFRSLKTAEKHAKLILHKHKCSKVKIYQINEQTEISAFSFKENDDKAVLSINA